MEDKLEKKLKEFLPYIIVIAVIYLVVPALLFINSDAVAYIVLIGILPLTALLCCAHYSMKKKNDLALAFIAPLFFLPAMFLYPIASTSLINALIYLAAYFLCGYLGLTIGDIFANRGKSKAPTRQAEKAGQKEARRTAKPEPAEARSAEARPAPSQRPRRVAVEAEARDSFEAADPYADSSLDTSTTDDDIDAILREIHQRHNNNEL